MADSQDFSVEESRAKRVERLQSKYRNRGGVFQPATHNALLDILLSRGVNGESPSKRRKSRKSFAPSTRDPGSPTIERRKSLTGAAEEVAEELTPKESAKGKAKATPSRRKSQVPKKRKSTAASAKPHKSVEVEVEDEEPVVGPSRTSKTSTKTSRRKAKEDSETEDQEDPPKKAVKRAQPKKAAKTTRTTRATKKQQEAEDEVIASVPPPKRASEKRSRRQKEPVEEDPDDEPPVPPKRVKTASERPSASSSGAHKQPLETILEESDSEEDIPLRLIVKRAKAKAGKGASSIGKVPSKQPVIPDAASKPKKAVSKPKAGTDEEAATMSKRSKAKANEPDEDDAVDTQPMASSSGTIQNYTKAVTSKRKLPAVPEPFVDSDSDEDLPPKPKATKPSYKQADGAIKSAATPNDRDDASFSRKPRPAHKDGKSAASAREDVDEPEHQEPSMTSRKRERGKPASAVPPPEDELDADDQPAPPRKRTKRSAALVNGEASGHVPASVGEEADQIEPVQEEEPSVKPKSKSTSRTKKPPSSQTKTESKQCVP
ncbi:uncharacterized protein C8Q71DRAFT_556983 [Rhodofomes roseus]|uniref:Uncharacterized protein n=1 Tax=Rhodofomes roseus TaxID=34475 RepID=A0ABQ8KJL7_9APHY|nr:uncharacterized protein C8Q71DRAFT_556983 [Rhodofomes roseus]KAH9837699.1 hypothetical protein C8Q71DRAFT_556983 [Rhodofomes roseus]